MILSPVICEHIKHFTNPLFCEKQNTEDFLLLFLSYYQFISFRIASVSVMALGGFEGFGQTPQFREKDS